MAISRLRIRCSCRKNHGFIGFFLIMYLLGVYFLLFVLRPREKEVKFKPHRQIYPNEKLEEVYHHYENVFGNLEEIPLKDVQIISRVDASRRADKENSKVFGISRNEMGSFIQESLTNGLNTALESRRIGDNLSVVLPQPARKDEEAEGLQLQLADRGEREADPQYVSDAGDAVTFPYFNEWGLLDSEGQAITSWSRDSLSPEQQAEWDQGFQRNSFNQFISDRISVHRTIEDNRPQVCKDAVYPAFLPACSVVIIFHNEAWSTLLRSVNSVLENTSPHLLHQVLLIDDKSTMDHLGKPLDKYFSYSPKVQILRMPERGGLTQARLLGFRAVTADIVVFLDSHIECMQGWYEPLVTPIAEDYRKVTVPALDNIRWQDLSYFTAPYVQLGSFDMSTLLFSWFERPVSKEERHQQRPMSSPTMPGGLFAVSRLWFQELGKYDPGLQFWGGENMELSFKTWMCNGSLLMVPCSHIGHIFRTKNPITWNDPSFHPHKNSMRVAEVWMDQYIGYFLEHLGNQKNLDIGDITERKALREKLHCHSFDWYVNNVFPELRSQIDDSAPYAGEIRSNASGLCIDSGKANSSIPLLLTCHGNGGSQFWLLTAEGLLQQSLKIYVSVTDSGPILTGSSNSAHQWTYNEKTGVIKHLQSGQCLQASEDDHTLFLAPCWNSAWQVWSMQPRVPELLRH